jgi:uncharacterized membrane protein YphA (DoxX/SURF4 family)
MTANKKNKIFFWVFTLLFLLPSAGSGVFELFSNGPQVTVQTLTLLGYPLFLMKILGFSKLLGALAILTGRIPRMKEWAYAGFSFLFLGATASHLLAGDTAHAPIPFIFFILAMVSYYFSNKAFSRSSGETIKKFLAGFGVRL